MAKETMADNAENAENRVRCGGIQLSVSGT